MSNKDKTPKKLSTISLPLSSFAIYQPFSLPPLTLLNKVLEQSSIATKSEQVL